MLTVCRIRQNGYLKGPSQARQGHPRFGPYRYAQSSSRSERNCAVISEDEVLTVF
jgi:hypothetical protein